jgi:phenylalanine-4-hydroxylase
MSSHRDATRAEARVEANIGAEDGGGLGGSEVQLVALDRDHPGFKDKVYRERRDEIAALALDYDGRGPLPSADYNEVEQGIWKEVWSHLDPLHQQKACRAYLEGCEIFRFSRDHIPSFASVNQRLVRLQGFTLSPVAGLVMPLTFLEQLAQRRFLATQYMRHHSEPLYTPEPDVVHEYVGHVPSLAHPELAELNEAFGHATLRGREDPARIEALIRVYWYTIEFGLLQEDDAIKVYGAGILSSFGELHRCDQEPELRNWDLGAMAADEYDPTNYQAHLYVAPSFARMRDDLLRWLEG